jgi:16S rRNA (guanine(966)-N(2))-methyltransferase RsmD
MGGEAKGRKLNSPRDLTFRPTTGRVKEFLFSFLMTRVKDEVILDLFAGSGSLGIEALSRGAEKVVFVDSAALSQKLLKENLNLCGWGSRAQIIRDDVFKTIHRFGRKNILFELIFADPPFKMNYRSRILKTAYRDGILSDDGLLIIEHEGHDKDNGEHGFRLIKQRRFGHCMVSIYGSGGKHANRNLSRNL